MSYNLSACCFIRNTFTGAFMLPESMTQLLPLVDEMIIVDYGSTDDTREFLKEVSFHNKKVKIYLEHSFPLDENGQLDASVFAKIANDLVSLCSNDRILYWQSDEIWHEDLVRLMRQRFEQGDFDLSFWRIQYANNFQYVKWFPHLVHRVSIKGSNLSENKNNFEFTGDGMNTDRVWDAKICSNFGGEMFPKWGELGQQGIVPYTHEMITDISLIGAFRDNIGDRRRMHAPFWHEEPTIPFFTYVDGKVNQVSLPESEWYARMNDNPDWTKTESPYNLPDILKWHVGRVKYELRQELLEQLYVL